MPLADEPRQENMGIKTMNKRFSARRAATFLAVLGALVMSSGVALMVGATSASATPGHTPVNICHATSSDTNPYVFITVDADSKRYQAHLAHRNTPNKTWNKDTMWGGSLQPAGSAKPDLIQGLDGDVTADTCKGGGEVVENPPAVADVDFTDPTCAAPDSGSVDTTGQNADFTVAPLKASYSIGDVVTVDAAATGESAFDQGAVTHWEHTFAASDAPCTVVNPPGGDTEGEVIVSTPKVHHKAHAAAVTPTVVHAGLTSVSADDMRGEQGLALMFAGMLMLMAAGGLGLRMRGVASRI